MSELNEQEKLKKLANERRMLADLMISNNDNSHKLIAEKLYDKQSHFIFELLQNAEDEQANEAYFKLDSDCLIFTHDGKPFTFNDIKSISNFGDNNLKKRKSNAIGRFGIGFKSVYAITSTPIVRSGDFHIEILDYNVPNSLPNLAYEKHTVISLPFNHSEKDNSSTYVMLKKELEDFDSAHLLFLTNIRKIKIEINNTLIELEKKVLINKSKNKNIKVERAVLLSGKESKEFLAFKKSLIIEGKSLEVQIAYLTNGVGKKKQIQKLDKSPLYVFFPTSKETNTTFLVHAPFETTPARDNVAEDVSGNIQLYQTIAGLFIDSLFELKILNLLNVNLLINLPINEDECQRSTLYDYLYSALHSVLQSNAELIPISPNGFSSASNVLLTGSADVAQLLNPAQTKKLFGRSYWVDKSITENKTKVLRDFLYYDLEIPEPDFAEFAKSITGPFLKAQTDKWIIEFYKTLYNSRLQWNESFRYSGAAWTLRSKAIIRDESNNQVIPFDFDGKPNIFLPTEVKSEYPTVKRKIAKEPTVSKFLEALGISKPNLIDEVNEFILPKFANPDTDYLLSEEYINDLSKIVSAYFKVTDDKKSHLTNSLKNLSFVLVKSSDSEEFDFTYPELAYFPDRILIDYFQHGSYDFVDDRLFLLQKSHKLKIREFLEEVGVLSVPKRIEVEAELSEEEKKSLRNGEPAGTVELTRDYYLDGLYDGFFNNTSLEKSLNLWQILCNCIIKINSNDRLDFFKGIYIYKVRRKTNYVYFDSKFYNQLISNSWLITDQGELKAPHEITFEELDESFKVDLEISQELAEILRFKLDEVKIFEQRTGLKVISAEEHELLERLKNKELEQSKQKASKDDNGSYRFEPEIEAGVEIEEPETLDDSVLENSFSPTYDPKIRVDEEDNSNDEEEEGFGGASEDPVNNDQQISAKTLKEIGNWGEKEVEAILRLEFAGRADIEIINPNKRGTARGYDFIIKEEGQVIRYVEVKTSVGSITQNHIISGPQWETARKLYEAGKGDLYYIYCNFNAGKSTKHTKIIKNPIKLWHEGKIIANPINFVVNLKSRF